MLKPLAALALLMATPALAQPVGPYATGAEQQAAMRAAAITAEGLVRADLERIERIDRQGPKLNSVLAVNPHAAADARALDKERKAGTVRGPLHGLPILLKDNIDSADDTATTAGSLALKGNVTGRDAPIVQRLTDAGAVILGKANLSEWANFRSNRSVSGWSAVGGLVRNPYALDRGACGSSAGSAAAVAAGIATAAIGTETDGSITCPAAVNGVVGLKPTVGLVSRTFIVPISPEQDTAGPIARSVRDAAEVLSVIAGSDPADPATKAADSHRRDYAAGLDAEALKGAKIGVWRTGTRSPDAEAAFVAALEGLRRSGAVLVEVTPPDAALLQRIGTAEGEALRAEFRPALEAYLATTPAALTTRTLAELMAFNAATPGETLLFGQEIFEQAAKAPALSDPAYRTARADARRLATEALTKMMTTAGVEAIVASSGGPAPVVDPVNGARSLGSASMLPAVAGTPHLTVPAGLVSGLPVGLSFLGPAWSERRLLALGYAFEQAMDLRLTPRFRPSVNGRPEIADAFDP